MLGPPPSFATIYIIIRMSWKLYFDLQHVVSYCERLMEYPIDQEKETMWENMDEIVREN